MTGDLTFLHGMHTPRCIATVDKHFAYHTVQLMTGGQVELFYDDRRHVMSGAWVWGCHPGPHIRFHEWPTGRPWEHRYVAFTGPRATEWEAQGLWFTEPQEMTSPEHTLRLVGWFDELLSAKQDPGRWSQRTAVNLLERILLDLAQHRQRATEPFRPDWLAPVMEFLTRFDGDEPDYEALADRYGMSLSTLRRRFKALVGASVHDYRLQCRITQARRALGDTAAPIKRIAATLGYRDVFYFSRQFRQRAGVSPAAYRKSRQV